MCVGVVPGSVGGIGLHKKRPNIFHSFLFPPFFFKFFISFYLVIFWMLLAIGRGWEISRPMPEHSELFSCSSGHNRRVAWWPFFFRVFSSPGQFLFVLVFYFLGRPEKVKVSNLYDVDRAVRNCYFPASATMGTSDLCRVKRFEEETRCCSVGAIILTPAFFL